MKLLINEALDWRKSFPAGMTAEDRESYRLWLEHVDDVLKRFTVFRDLEVGATEARLRIDVQKVNLPEEEMNTLFHDALMQLFDFRLHYAALGGEGCGFSMELADVTVK